MRAFRHFSIRSKLTIIVMLTSGVAMLLACGTFAVYEQVAATRTLKQDFALLADMFDDNVAPGLAFNDTDSIGKTLATLGADSRIMAAGVYDRSGRLVARYDSPGLPPGFAFPPAAVTGQRFGNEHLATFKSIELAGETVGAVCILTDLHQLHRRAWSYVAGVAGLLLGCSLVALLLASRLQRIISRPISALADTAARVATGQDYDIRAVKHSDDEIGVLIDGFNAMLAQIQARDAKLLGANEELEHRVAERTRELQQEIAERRRSEQALQESHRRFEIVSRATADVIWDRDIAKNTVWRNENSARLFGYAPGELEATPEGWAAMVHPDDLAPALARLDETLRSGAPVWSADYRFRRRDGSYAHILDRGYVLRNEAGVPVRIIGAMQDITELKEAQQAAAREHAKFKFIFDAVPVGISLVVPGNDATRLVNPAHERITGLSAADSCRKDAFACVSHPDDYARQQALVQKFVRNEIDHYTMEKRYLRPDGSVTWTVLTSRMFVDPATGRQQVITTLVDITDRKQAEAELAQTHQQLLEVSRRAGMAEVATGVLHNVGNVLNSVNVSATLIADHVRESKAANLAKVAALFREHEADLAAFLATDPRGRQVPGYVMALAEHVAHEQAGSLRELESLRRNIEHIRDIVAMQQSYAKFSGVAESVSLVDLVEDSLRMNATALVRHEVALVRDFRARPAIVVEKHKVLQILVNLIRNAKYACDDGGRRDKQIIIRTEEHADNVTIAVIDNGVGIPPENLTRIFGHGFTTRKNGHGFGLHSGSLAARELGGDLIVHSDGLGRGATFTLVLPKGATEPSP